MNETYAAIETNKLKLLYQILTVGLFILLADQLSKFLVYRFIPLMDASTYWYPYGGIGIFRNLWGIEFSINHMTNKGAAWGFLGNYQLPLIVLRIILISGLSIYLFFYNSTRAWQLPLILIIAGAVGNVLDFFIYGHVVDMLHFVLWGYDFPVFNIADSAISIGIGLLFLLSWIKA
ncbi:signal peptidase II [Candidatus Protochlamydia phocaeensis]|uniref:signal peptidase II n=1 Tax=Candidatus Protochlamydia phocaeensis TaxID=1414722 RepID=UPI000838CF41|nr:signal peptidase II [Candidatus Protochlamydia phocaeensis]